MPVHISIPSNLRPHTSQLAKIEVEGSVVGPALQQLCAAHPDLRPKLFASDAELHSFINVFVNSRSIRDLDGLATPLAEGDTLLIVPALAGG